MSKKKSTGRLPDNKAGHLVIKAESKEPERLDFKTASSDYVKDTRHNEMRSKVTFWVTLITCIAVCGYTVISGVQSYHIAKQTELANRAWVTVKDIEAKELAPNKPCRVSFENSGKSPAMGRLIVNISLRNKSEAIPSLVEDCLSGNTSRAFLSERSTFVIGPGHVNATDTYFPNYDPSKQALILSSDVICYIYGLVEYEDGFKKKRHYAFSSYLDAGKLQWIQCKTGNYAD